jgi:hypothetical protein
MGGGLYGVEAMVDSSITVPCPIDEVQLQKGKEEIRKALDELYATYLRQGYVGGQQGEVVNVEIIEQTKEAIEEQLDRWNYCEVDEDCEAFYGECPFGCHQVVNKQFVQPAQQLINDRKEKEAKKGNPQCVYSCMQLLGVQCREQKCVTRAPLPKSHP